MVASTSTSTSATPFVTKKSYKQETARGDVTLENAQLWQKVSTQNNAHNKVVGFFDMTTFPTGSISGLGFKPSEMPIKIKVNLTDKPRTLTLRHNNGQPQTFKIPAGENVDNSNSNMKIGDEIELEFKFIDGEYRIKLDKKNPGSTDRNDADLSNKLLTENKTFNQEFRTLNDFNNLSPSDLESGYLKSSGSEAGQTQRSAAPPAKKRQQQATTTNIPATSPSTPSVNSSDAQNLQNKLQDAKDALLQALKDIHDVRKGSKSRSDYRHKGFGLSTPTKDNIAAQIPKLEEALKKSLKSDAPIQSYIDLINKIKDAYLSASKINLSTTQNPLVLNRRNSTLSNVLSALIHLTNIFESPGNTSNDVVGTQPLQDRLQKDIDKINKWMESTGKTKTITQATPSNNSGQASPALQPLPLAASSAVPNNQIDVDLSDHNSVSASFGGAQESINSRQATSQKSGSVGSVPAEVNISRAESDDDKSSSYIEELVSDDESSSYIEELVSDDESSSYIEELVSDDKYTDEVVAQSSLSSSGWSTSHSATVLFEDDISTVASADNPYNNHAVFLSLVDADSQSTANSYHSTQQGSRAS